MIDSTQKIELLAPAKNKECAFVAIDAGADAVYIGSEAFGARKRAGNSLADIKEIVDYAHKFSVKIYVTVNTLIFDGEIKKVEKLVWDLYKTGVDAVIFQDFSFFEMNLPPIALHASTQCNNDTLEKIKFLKNCNVQRVVLPREFSIDEIKNITKNCDIETEVFIHGALCVSYSGQCYFSNYIGGRSANRGDCAQPCRKKYSMVDENGDVILKPQYLLSMKDFSLSSHLDELIEAGVTSLKIEGRLKDAEYVKNIVSFYRKKIDEKGLNLKPSLGAVQTDFEPDPCKTFNRGYTDFNFDGNRKIVINPLTPKFQGEKIGEILSIAAKRIKIDSKTKLYPNDRISYFDKNNELTGTTIFALDAKGYEVRDLGDLKVGTIVWRNYDSEFVNKLNSAKFTRKIPISFDIEQKGERVSILVKSKDGIFVNYEPCDEFEFAKNAEKAQANALQQFSKLGETEFIATEINIDSGFNLFIPVSKLNEIRRNAIAQLVKERENNYKRQSRETNIEIPDYPVKELDYSYNVANQKTKEFYKKAGANVKEFCPECVKPKTKTTLMKTKHCLRDFAGICLKNTKNPSDLYLLDDYGGKYGLSFDCKDCLMQIDSIGK